MAWGLLNAITQQNQLCTIAVTFLLGFGRVALVFYNNNFKKLNYIKFLLLLLLTLSKDFFQYRSYNRNTE